MRADIVFRGCQKSIAIPEEVCLVGVTVIYNDNHCSALDLDFIDRRTKEIVMSEEFKVILHYYTTPAIVEIGKEFFGFEGMRYLEIQERDYYVGISV